MKWAAHAETMLAEARQHALKLSGPHCDGTPSAEGLHSVTPDWFLEQARDAAAALAALPPLAELQRAVKVAKESMRAFEENRPAMEAMAHSAKAIHEAWPAGPPYNSALAAFMNSAKRSQR